MIRKAITDCFQILIHDIHKFNGISELLNIIAAIISGFAVPLREEHIIFFKNIIIPLHKVQTCPIYLDNLIRCSKLFFKKDPSLAILLLEGILKYWPFANFVKETLFLQELSEILEFCDIEQMKPLITKLFTRLVKCISGSHLKVADRAMSLFENESLVNITKSYKQTAFAILVPVVSKLAENHWHNILKESLIYLKEILYKIDSNEFEIALEIVKTKIKEDIDSQLSDEREKIDLKWKTFSNNAKIINSDYYESIIPYSEDVILSDFNKVYKNIFDKEKYKY